MLAVLLLKAVLNIEGAIHYETLAGKRVRRPGPHPEEQAVVTHTPNGLLVNLHRHKQDAPRSDNRLKHSQFDAAKEALKGKLGGKWTGAKTVSGDTDWQNSGWTVPHEHAAKVQDLLPNASWHGGEPESEAPVRPAAPIAQPPRTVVKPIPAPVARTAPKPVAKPAAKPSAVSAKVGVTVTAANRDSAVKRALSGGDDKAPVVAMTGNPKLDPQLKEAQKKIFEYTKDKRRSKAAVRADGQVLMSGKTYAASLYGNDEKTFSDELERALDPGFGRQFMLNHAPDWIQSLCFQSGWGNDEGFVSEWRPLEINRGFPDKGAFVFERVKDHAVYVAAMKDDKKYTIRRIDDAGYHPDHKTGRIKTHEAGARFAHNKATDAKINSPAFKSWFGDSKVVADDGTPLVVSHGTAAGGYTQFDADSLQPGLYGKGFYFTEDQALANEYERKGTDELLGLGPGGIDSKRAGVKEKIQAITKQRIKELTKERDLLVSHAAKLKGKTGKERERSKALHEANLRKKRIDGLTGSLTASSAAFNDLYERSKYMNSVNLPTDREWYERVKAVAEHTKLKSTTYNVYLSIKNPIDVDVPIPAPLKKKVLTALEPMIAPGAHLRAAKMASQGHVVDERKIEAKRLRSAADIHTFNDLYGHIVSYGFDEQAAKQKLNDVLQSHGYDGLTHIGGSFAGNGDRPHRVWIAFKPNQIKAVDNDGNFSKKTNDIYKSMTEILDKMCGVSVVIPE